MNEFELIIVRYVSEILVDTQTPAPLQKARFEAIVRLRKMLLYYKSLNFIDELLTRIAQKKCEMLKQATSKTEMDKILKLRCPHYNGNRFVTDEYCVPEEELIGWSMASLSAPLNDVGFKRYMEVFQEVFPNESHDVLKYWRQN